VALKPPGPVIAPLLEWRAGRIRDPVERLRFLKSAASRVSAGPALTCRTAWKWQIPSALLGTALLFVPAPVPSTVRRAPPVRSAVPAVSEERLAPAVWLVEQTSGFEVFSNGLRVEKEFATGNRPRGSYPVFRRNWTRSKETGEEAFDWGTQPVGIVFHSTESHQAPFEPAETRNLKRLGRNLLDFIRSNRSYHYLIDRFGRVYRVVEESDTANHAGRSVWADAKGTYVYLNQSFLGVAIESQSSAEPAISTAQVHAARVLTEMLRSKYQIAAEDCVTHAQVSVNPLNYRIGYHTDWAIGFPFAEAGLPDNYRLPLASMTTFGFEYDNSFLNVGGDRRWPGLLASLDSVRDQSQAAGVPAPEYRRQLRQRFQNVVKSAVMRARGEDQ
jgi:hypothetical protein